MTDQDKRKVNRTVTEKRFNWPFLSNPNRLTVTGFIEKGNRSFAINDTILNLDVSVSSDINYQFELLRITEARLKFHWCVFVGWSYDSVVEAINKNWSIQAESSRKKRNNPKVKPPSRHRNVLNTFNKRFLGNHNETK